MEFFEDMLNWLRSIGPSAGAVVAVVVFLWLVDRAFRRRAKPDSNMRHFGRQIIMLILTVIGLVVIILALPVDTETRKQLFSLLGIALTAVVALSSTTIVANALAGFMLRSAGRYRPGDSSA